MYFIRRHLLFDIDLSLISIHIFRLPPAKVFALDMPKLAEPIESDEKHLSLCSHLKFKYFDLCKIFFQRNQSDFFLKSGGAFTIRHQYSSQNKNYRLQISFFLRQFFAALKVAVNL